MMDAVQKALRVAKADGGGNVQGFPDPVGTPAPISTGNEAFVGGLYKNILNRESDPQGMQNWLGALNAGTMNQKQVQEAFLSSPENVVQDLYAGLLNRPTLDPGAQGWISALQNQTMTPEQIRAGIMASEEYKGLNPSAGGQAGGTQTPVVNTGAPVNIAKRGMPLIYTPPPYKDYGATAAAFRVASGLENLPEGFRTLSPVVGGTPSDSTTGAGTTSGKPTYQQILQQLTQQPTLTTGKDTLTGGTGNDTATSKFSASDIAALYNQYLGRAPETGAAQAWLNQINSNNMTYNDVVNAIKTSPEGQVFGAYEKYLNRKPEEGAASNWANEVVGGGMSLQDALRSIAFSPEAFSGATQAATTAGTAADPVTIAYQTYLGRAPDAEGAAAWNNAIASGVMTPEEVMAAIANSPEAQTRTFASGGAVKEYADGGSPDYASLVNAAYRDFLYRDPDEKGFNDWLTALNRGEIKPADFESRFKGAGYEDEIANAYMQYLDRPPEKNAAANWIGQINDKSMTLDQVLQAIRSSPEALTMPTYRNVPTADKYSELQGGRMYDIDIGRGERIPKLGIMDAPVNVKQEWENSEIARLQAELEAAKAAGTSKTRDMGGGGGGGEGGSNFGASDPSGTSGAIGVDSAAGPQGPPSPGDSGSNGPGERYGGRINAVDNALRLIKANRH